MCPSPTKLVPMDKGEGGIIRSESQEKTRSPSPRKGIPVSVYKDKAPDECCALTALPSPDPASLTAR